MPALLHCCTACHIPAAACPPPAWRSWPWCQRGTTSPARRAAPAACTHMAAEQKRSSRALSGKAIWQEDGHNQTSTHTQVRCNTPPHAQPSSPAAVVVVKAPGHDGVVAIGGCGVVLAQPRACTRQLAANHSPQHGRAGVFGRQAQRAVHIACGWYPWQGVRQCDWQCGACLQTAAARPGFPVPPTLSPKAARLPPLGLLEAQDAYTLALRAVRLVQGGSQSGSAAGGQAGGGRGSAMVVAPAAPTHISANSATHLRRGHAPGSTSRARSDG